MAGYSNSKNTETGEGGGKQKKKKQERKEITAARIHAWASG
jgi:hypothetical protein